MNPNFFIKLRYLLTQSPLNIVIKLIELFKNDISDHDLGVCVSAAGAGDKICSFIIQLETAEDTAGHY